MEDEEEDPLPPELPPPDPPPLPPPPELLPPEFLMVNFKLCKFEDEDDDDFEESIFNFELLLDPDPEVGTISIPPPLEVP